MEWFAQIPEIESHQFSSAKTRYKWQSSAGLSLLRLPAAGIRKTWKGVWWEGKGSDIKRNGEPLGKEAVAHWQEVLS